MSEHGVPRFDNLCPEAHLAALMAAEGLAEARKARADLQRQPLQDLDPHPAEASTDVDDKPHQFADKEMADQYLRGVPSSGILQLPSPRPSIWEQHTRHVAARAFEAAREAGVTALRQAVSGPLCQAAGAPLPRLAVFGEGDGLDGDQRAFKLRACVRQGMPFAAVAPVLSVDDFLAVDGEGHYVSAAIVVLSPKHVAVSVATGQTTAVGTNGELYIHREGDHWVAAEELPKMPVRPGSFCAPMGAPTRRRNASSGSHYYVHGAQNRSGLGNRMMLEGLILGGLEGIYQAECGPLEGAGMYLAASAGFVVLNAATEKASCNADQIQVLLIRALRENGSIPAFIAAQYPITAHRILADFPDSIA